ncbi:ATPase [gut metagenome]|uniref:ATPase n=1 Tax=gut metagenome TaxID=749906 RepID=J9D8Q2_9ZZZZ
MTNSAGLAGFTTAADVNHHIKRFNVFRELERLHDNHAARFTGEVLFQRAAVDHDLASATLDENTSDRALAAAGAVVVITDHLSSLSELEVKNLGLLGGVRVFGAGIDLELLDHGVAKRSLREHTLDSDFESAARMLGLHFSESRFVDATRVAGMTVVRLLTSLFSAELQLVSVDNDDKVTRVNVGREFGLVLAAEAQSDFAGKTAEHLITGIDHEPVALNLKRLGREGLHCVSPNIKIKPFVQHLTDGAAV